MAHNHIHYSGCTSSHQEAAGPSNVNLKDITGHGDCEAIVRLIATARGATSGGVNGYVVTACAKNTSGMSVVGTPTVHGSYEGDAGWACTLDVDGSDIVATLTSDAAEHVEWTLWWDVWVNADT
jgi:hypothetical protein